MRQIEIPLKTVAGLNAREHWRVRANRVKKERGTAKLMGKWLVAGVQLPATITLVRLSAGTLDGDNLQGAFKAVRDGIADAYGVADNDPRITFKYTQEKCARGKFGVVVKAEPL